MMKWVKILVGGFVLMMIVSKLIVSSGKVELITEEEAEKRHLQKTELLKMVEGHK